MKKIINNIKNNKLVFLFSIIESFLQVYGAYLSSNGGLKNLGFVALLIVIVLSIFFYCFNLFFMKILSIKYKSNDKYVFSKKKFLILWLLIFVMWIPVLLSYYPTLWAYDVYLQVPHLEGSKFITHQPLFHTLFIELFLIIGKSIKNYELGMLFLSIVQMLIMSCVFAYTIEKIKSKIDNKLLRRIFTIFMILFYGILPINSILSISMTKDIIFSGMLLFFTLNIYEVMENNSINKKQFICLVFSSVLMILFKNNIFGVFLCFTIAILFNKNTRKYFLKMCMYSITIYYIIYFIIVLCFRPTKMPKEESYSVQLQTLFYVTMQHPNLSSNDKGFFEVFPSSCFDPNLSTYYDKNNADPVKTSAIYCSGNNFNEKKLVITWLKYGLKYPMDYIDSWSNLTIGSWYLLDESHANIYYGDNQGYLLTDYKLIRGVSDKRPKSKFPLGFKIFEKIATENVQYKSPLRIIFQPATYILLFFTMLIYLLSQKKFKEIVPLYCYVIIFISIINGPVIVIRYIYPYVVFVPILFFMILISNNKRED